MFLSSPAAWLAGAVFTALLVAVARSDVRSRRIPNALVLTILVTGVAASSTLLRESIGLRLAAAGVGLGLAVWMPFWLLRVLGAGDVKLAAAAGAWLGPVGVVEASLLAALAGGGLAIVLLARRGRVAPLATGAAMWAAAAQRGELTRPLVDDKTEVLPYGVALAAGAALAGWLPATWLTL
ncbi:MAG: prepilin peptidase [Gemmatimonadaceae bacterium]